MTFKLSNRSLSKLDGVNSKLIKVVKRAITTSKVDFGITEGVRSIETQREYVRLGKSQTMNSKHLTGNAVDVMVYVGSKGSWELNLYDDVADAFAEAANHYGISLLWGAAWNVPNIAEWNGTMEEAMMHYIDTRRAQGRRPFIDGPHFQLG
jgi:peptidoglycan L-alanyl-D-glutamate endopeptidase CwlK